jgi:hypothetical protein
MKRSLSKGRRSAKVFAYSIFAIYPGRISGSAGSPSLIKPVGYVHAESQLSAEAKAKASSEKENLSILIAAIVP